MTLKFIVKERSALKIESRLTDYRGADDLPMLLWPYLLGKFSPGKEDPDSQTDAVPEFRCLPPHLREIQ